MKSITIQTAKRYTDTKADVDSVESMWMDFLEYDKAELKRSRGDNRLYTLWIDNEPTEISYGYYKTERGNVELNPTHWYE